MDTVHLHLVLNHFPFIGALIGILVLVAGFFFKDSLSVRRVALSIFIFSALVAIPAYITGNQAEEAVENLSVFNENAVEHHEEITEMFLVVIEVLGLVSFLTLIADIRGIRMVRKAYVFILFFSIAAGIYGGLAGNSGAKIRHTEISGSPAGGAPNRPNPENENGENH